MDRADLLTERATMEPQDESRNEARQDEPERLTTPPGAPRDAADVEFDIGPRVTAVFTAAERAAQHIVDMAREEADDVRRRAEVEVESLMTQRRVQAEEEASRHVAEARAQADGIRAAAEEEARQMQESARRREVRIREETRLLEERVEWAREGLRDVADRLRETEALVTLPASDSSRPSRDQGAPPPRRDVAPAAAMSGYREPAGVEPGDELLEPDEQTDEQNRIPPP